MSAIVIIPLQRLGLSTSLLLASAAARKMFLVLFPLRLRPDTSPSLGIWEKFYQQMITGQTAHACPTGKGFHGSLATSLGGAGTTTGIPGQVRARGTLTLTPAQVTGLADRAERA